MITTNTKCSDCVHNNICKFKEQKEKALEILRKTKYKLDETMTYEKLSDQLCLSIDFRCLNFISNKWSSEKCTY